MAARELMIVAVRILGLLLLVVAVQQFPAVAWSVLGSLFPPGAAGAVPWGQSAFFAFSFVVHLVASVSLIVMLFCALLFGFLRAFAP